MRIVRAIHISQLDKLSLTFQVVGCMTTATYICVARHFRGHYEV